MIGLEISPVETDTCQRSKYMAILDDIREAIETSGESRYAIAKATGLSQTTLSRFVNGERGLSVDALETLADHLGLEVVLKKRRK